MYRHVQSSFTPAVRRLVRHSSSSAVDLNVVQLPTIDRINTYKSENNGIPGLFSAETLNDVWFNQLDHKLEDLKDIFGQLNHKSYIDCFNANSNDLTSGNRIINQYKNLLESISTKFEDDESYLFDTSASIYNLFYFFSSLKTNSTNRIEYPNFKSLLKTPSLDSINNLPTDESLLRLINKSFGSTDEFFTLLRNSANSIKGNGNTWLVYRHMDSSTGTYEKLSHLAILNTYNHGIPHAFTSNRIKNGKEFDLRNSGINSTTNPNIEKYSSQSIPTLEEASLFNTNEYTFTPLFAIGSNPSFYLRDYGIYGKSLYVNNVINSIDWNIIADRIPSRN